MSNDDMHQKLVDIVECDDAPSYAKVLAVAIIETRNELCYLKKLSKVQITLAASILAAIVGLMFK